MTAPVQKISRSRLLELIKEEAAKLTEAVDHKSINTVVSVASKLLAAVEGFKQKAPPSAINAVTPHLGEMERVLEDMVSSPGSYVARPKVEPKRVTLKAVKKEGNLREARMGQRVKIMSGMPQFVGQTGRIVGQETDGRTKMYRVRLDGPVDIPGIGPVTDDLWASEHLKVLREGTGASPGPSVPSAEEHPPEMERPTDAFSGSPPCGYCGSENTEQLEVIPSMAGYGEDVGVICLDCKKTSWSGPEMAEGAKKRVTEATGGDGKREQVNETNWQHLEVGNTYYCSMGRDSSISAFKGWVTPNTVQVTDSENPEEVNLLFADVSDGFEWEAYWSDGKYCVGSGADPLYVKEQD